MLAIHWLILDNAIHYWPLYSNMSKENYEIALRWADDHGFIVNEKITDKGRGYFMLYGHQKIKPASGAGMIDHVAL
jgi:hypothetical protein